MRRRDVSRAAQAVAAGVKALGIRPKSYVSSRRRIGRAVMDEDTEIGIEVAPDVPAVDHGGDVDAAPVESASDVAVGGVEDMATAQTGKTRKRKAVRKAPGARKAAPARGKAPKAGRANATRSGRLTADTVFRFKHAPSAELALQIPPRVRGFLSALERIGKGTSADVAKSVLKSEYSGKQDKQMIAADYLRRLRKLGVVETVSA